jgi:hypothetical protein
MKIVISGLAAAAVLCAAMSGWAATVSGSVSLEGAPGEAFSPVQGASIVAYRMNSRHQLDTARGARLDSVLSDADGAYAIAGLDTGRILLEARMQGYIFANPRTYLTLPEEAGHYVVNFTFRDTAHGDIKVTVVRDSLKGRPLAGAKAYLVAWQDDGSNREKLVDSGYTDADGRLAFAGRLPGLYAVSVLAEGFIGSDDTPGTARVVLQRLKTVSLSFVLWPEDAEGVISGTVAKASDGKAIPRAKLVLSTYYWPPTLTVAPMDSSTSASDGSYAFKGVPVQRDLMLTVKAAGYLTARAEYLTAGYNRTLPAPVFLFPANPSGTGGAAAAGVVTDTAGRGLAGVRAVYVPVYDFEEELRDTVVTDAEGRFFFPKVQTSKSYISVSKAGYLEESSEYSFHVLEGYSQMVYFTLKKERTTSAVAKAFREALRLHRGPAGSIILEAPARQVATLVRVYDIRGAVRFGASLPAGATRLEFPWARGRAGYVVVKCGKEFHRLAAPLVP